MTRSTRLASLVRGAFVVCLLGASLASGPHGPHSTFRDPEERAKVGSACQVHPKRRLRLDVVPIHYGIASFQAASGNEWKEFPNARVVRSMGCVIGRERWAEAAWCPDCRAAFYRHNPWYLLHPILPRD